MERCFNYSQCKPGNFKIYVYPMDTYDQESGAEAAVHSISPVYAKILDALRASKYATANPHEACVFIPPVDTVDRDPLSANYQRVSLENISLNYMCAHYEVNYQVEFYKAR